jgi:hypothetical protein
MASDLTGNEITVPPPAIPAAAEAPPPVAHEPRTPHRLRLMLVYGLLAGILVLGIAGVAVYAGRSISPAPVWSSWHPSGGGLGAAKQIAENVGKSYRLPNGDQLVDVIAKAPSIPGSGGAAVPIHYYAVRGTHGIADQVFPVSSSDSMMYTLCGLGTSCSIASGKPSVERGTLVRREILELALYTFKYVGGINSIVAFMPPKSGSSTQYAVFLQKDSLKPQLKERLSQTLSSKTPLPSQITPREVHLVDATTEPRIFTYGVSQTQTGDIVLVFSPLPA